MDNFSRCTGPDPIDSVIEKTERKTPPAGIPTVPKCDSPSMATHSATLSVFSSRLGGQTGKDAHKGRFSCSPRYGGDRKAPLRPAIDRGGFGICESLSQCGNYRKTIRLARRNHKPGGADLAGSVHVVRSLSG